MNKSINKIDLIKTCETGDILLYNSTNFFARAIELVTFSKFSHVSIILRDPTYIHPDLKGLYVLESGSENIKDVVSNKNVIGVQVIPLEHVLNQYESANFGYLYYRKLNCERNDFFYTRLKTLIMKTDGSPYNINPFDWIKAMFQINIGNNYKENTFWCSSLVSYIYINLDLLSIFLPWTIIPPKKFSYYENESLSFCNCNVEPEQFIKF